MVAGLFVGIGAKVEEVRSWKGKHLCLSSKSLNLEQTRLDLIEKKIHENMTQLVMSIGTQG